jgi:hypothetical protein
MPGWTNRGKYLQTLIIFQGATPPTNFYIALVRDTVAPGPDTNLLSELTQIDAGTGYTSGGVQLSRNATDFDNASEDDTNDLAEIQIKDITWTASGGNLDTNGNGARYAVLVDDSGAVWAYWNLGSNRQASDGQPLTLKDCKIRGKETT